MNGHTTAAPMSLPAACSGSAGSSPCPSTAFDVDLPGLASAFGQRLHESDMPVTPAQSVQYARALHLTEPRSHRQLYFMTRAIFVTDFEHVATFDHVFAEIFGSFDPANAGGLAIEIKPAALPAFA